MKKYEIYFKYLSRFNAFFIFLMSSVKLGLYNLYLENIQEKLCVRERLQVSVEPDFVMPNRIRNNEINTNITLAIMKLRQVMACANDKISKLKTI